MRYLSFKRGSITSKTKYIRLIILFYFISIITTNAQTEFSKRCVFPSNTDNTITEWLTPHYVVYNKSLKKASELLIFFPGTDEKPSSSSILIDSIAKNVTHTIALTYPNTLTPWSYCQDKNEFCFELFRREVLWGVNDTVLQIQNINKSNSVINRITKLLEYLSINYPQEGWSNFCENNSINWEKIILGGFSQGGGLSLFISKYYGVKRVVLISSPSDYFLKTKRSAPWLGKNGQTNSALIYSFSSQTDNIVPFEIQKKNWGIIGIPGTQVTINSNSKLNSEHMLTLKDGNHSTPEDVIYAPIWKYLFNTSNLTTNSKYVNVPSVQIEQFSSDIIIDINRSQDCKISLLNTMGIELYSYSTKQGKIVIPKSNIPSGIYIIVLSDDHIFYSQKIHI